MKKLFIASFITFFAATSLISQAAEQAVVDSYNKSCAMCHASGAAGAPKTGSADDWAPRMKKGMDTLVASATNGLNAMPPKGMCFDCSADDFKALIEYMSVAK